MARHLSQVPWPMSSKIHFQLRELLALIQQEQGRPPDELNISTLESLKDDIRHLPGYPRNYSDPDRYEIVPKVTTMRSY